LIGAPPPPIFFCGLHDLSFVMLSFFVVPLHGLFQFPSFSLLFLFPSCFSSGTSSSRSVIFPPCLVLSRPLPLPCFFFFLLVKFFFFSGLWHLFRAHQRFFCFVEFSFTSPFLRRLVQFRFLVFCISFFLSLLALMVLGGKKLSVSFFFLCVLFFVLLFSPPWGFTPFLLRYPPFPPSAVSAFFFTDLTICG